MQIQNSTIDDLEFIFDLYRSATAYQKERFISHWPEFDRDMVINEIEGEIVCIWATTFSDPLIWVDKDADPSVYIHRISTNPNCRGKAYVKQIVVWAKLYAIQNNKKFIRLDTVGENQKLIEHYTSFGFSFLGLSQLTNTADLPMHYHNATVSLFELSV